MKTRIFLAILLLGWLFPFLPASAEVVEIPLVTEAAVEPWDDHAVTFDAGQPLPDVTGVSLRLVGEGGGVPYLSCMDLRYSFTAAGSLTVELRGEVPTLAMDTINHSFGTSARAFFEVLLAFGLEDYSFLSAGIGTLVFLDPAGMISNSEGQFCPVGNGCVLTEATLIVEYGATVKVDGTTWGALKAVYR